MSQNGTEFSDVHEIHQVKVATSSLGSNSSIGTGSPTLLNPESLDVRSSLGSSHGTPTVKFAPLPQIDPSRKRSLAPLGVSARSRRRRVIQQEAESLLWCTDPDVPEENMEDPLITFAKFVKKTGKTLWRRVRKGSKAVVPQENVPYPAEPVLDIKSTVHPGGIMVPGEKGERVSKAVGGENKRERRASWSPSDSKRRTLSLGEVKRRSTSDLARLRVHAVM